MCVFSHILKHVLCKLTPIEKLWTKTSKTQQDTTVSKLKIFHLVEKLGQQNLKYCYIEIAVQKIENIVVKELSL